MNNYDAKPLLHPIETLQGRGACNGIGAIALAGLRLPVEIALRSDIYQRTQTAWRVEGPGRAVLAAFGIRSHVGN